MELKRTKLYNKHVSLGAKIVEFAGWEMPVQYSNLVEEHNTVRNKVGIFDVSHMGTFKISGADSFNFLQKMVPNDLNRIHAGKAIYTQFCKEDGNVIDDLIIYYIKPELFYMVVNASNVEKDFSWLEKNVSGDVKLENLASQTAVLALQGPFAEKTLQQICSYDLSTIKSFCLVETNILGVDLIVSRTGYTGEDGFELIFNNEYSEKIFDEIFKSGSEFDIKAIGLGARDTLRLESNLPLYGHELNEETSPIEAKLTWSVKLEKGDFIGSSVLAKQKSEGTSKKLIGLKSLSRAIPREGYELSFENEIVGRVTSGTFSPTLNYPIALAYVNTKREYNIGDTLEVIIRGKNHPVEIIALPFYKRNRS
jgi:aminomethyltransferase